MKIVVTGASGNVGTALLRRLAGTGAEVVGVARRMPDTTAAPYDCATWTVCDVGEPTARDTLADAMAGADAVVHLAWLIQPSRDADRMRRTNVEGTRHVVEAALRAGVPHLVHASSVGTYSPGPKDRAVDETWPTAGIGTLAYSRHKALVEAYLDGIEAAHAHLKVARLRPGLIFQRDAASEISRYFLGRLVPVGLLDRVRIPVLPLPDDLVFQAVHTDDVADAYARAVERGATGAFNIAADPVLHPSDVAAALGARHVPVPFPVVRGLAAATWRARLQPTPAGWLDLAAAVPVMSTERAERELGWTARRTSLEALDELLQGMGDLAGAPSPPLHPRG